MRERLLVANAVKANVLDLGLYTGEVDVLVADYKIVGLENCRVHANPCCYGFLRLRYGFLGAAVCGFFGCVTASQGTDLVC